MRTGLEVVGFLIGAAAVVAVLLSAIEAVVLPRASQARLPTATTVAVRGAFMLRARRAQTFEDRDQALAMLAPVALLALLALWLVTIIAAYTLMFFTTTGRSIVRSFELSGSSVFTLGTTSDPRLGPSILSYTEAALGLLLVALFITYFPSIYNAFSRRESFVALFEVRAGNPPRPAEMLIRYHRIEGRLEDLHELWSQWEAWFADIEETHTTFPILAFFRSPQPQRNWVAAAGVLLDGASMWAGCVEHPPDPRVQLCIRGGYLSLRRIADGFGIPYDPDPAPDDPISVSREEWDDVMAELEAAGVPLVADREEAWRAWSGWRVNYDTVLLRLATLVEAPMIPWVSDRTPIYPKPWRRRLEYRHLALPHFISRSSSRRRDRDRISGAPPQ
jgi:hypothetical protein